MSERVRQDISKWFKMRMITVIQDARDRYQIAGIEPSEMMIQINADLLEISLGILANSTSIPMDVLLPMVETIMNDSRRDFNKFMQEQGK